MASFVVAAAELGGGAVTGGLAFATIHDVQSRCSGIRCPPLEQANVNAASTLGSVSTTSLVLGGGGVAAEAIIVIRLCPSGNAPRALRAALRVGVERFDFERSF